MIDDKDVNVAVTIGFDKTSQKIADSVTTIAVTKADIHLPLCLTATRPLNINDSTSRNISVDYSDYSTYSLKALQRLRSIITKVAQDAEGPIWLDECDYDFSDRGWITNYLFDIRNTARTDVQFTVSNLRDTFVEGIDDLRLFGKELKEVRKYLKNGRAKTDVISEDEIRFACVMLKPIIEVARAKEKRTKALTFILA